MTGNREKPSSKLRTYAKALDLAYNDSAGALKNISVFPYIVAPGQALSPVKTYDKGKILALFNSDAVIHYYRTYAAGVTPTAPTGITDGIPVPVGQYMLVTMGEDTQIVTDSATVYAFEIDDDGSFVK